MRKTIRYAPFARGIDNAAAAPEHQMQTAWVGDSSKLGCNGRLYREPAGAYQIWLVAAQINRPHGGSHRGVAEAARPNQDAAGIGVSAIDATWTSRVAVSTLGIYIRLDYLP